METWLPLFFTGIMGFSLLVYVILDGYDLGIGLLLPFAREEEKDQMIASIGPFWDANETWIVLGTGILLITFPRAHGVILTALYLPVTLMLAGLILRGIAFDFRAKVIARKKQRWNTLFAVGSLVTALAQGWMLGSYITGLETSLINLLFSVLIALTLPALYILLGAAWLLLKTENTLYDKAFHWAKLAILPMGFAFLLISIATPLVSTTIAEKWFSSPQSLKLLPVPMLSAVIYAGLVYLLLQREYLTAGREWLLFCGLALLCLLASVGLAYSMLPYIILDRITIWESAASTNSLLFIFWGTAVVLPVNIVYSIFLYRVFSGKADPLDYGQ